jgi:hypothetical protein
MPFLLNYNRQLSILNSLNTKLADITRDDPIIKFWQVAFQWQLICFAKSTRQARRNQYIIISPTPTTLMVKFNGQT